MKKLILYTAAVLLTVYMALIYRSQLLAGLAAAEILIPLPFLLLAWLTVRKLNVRISAMTPAVERNQKIKLRISVENPLPVPVVKGEAEILCWNRFQSRQFLMRVPIQAEGGGRREFFCQCASLHCGNLIFQIRGIRNWDYLRLVSFRRKRSAYQEVAVLPSPFELELPPENPLSIQEDGERFDQHRSGDDPSEIFQIREYRQGDRISDIHWKMTARAEELMVKEHSRPLKEGGVLFLDLYAADADGEWKEPDGYLDLLFSFCLALLEDQRSCQAVWLGAGGELEKLDLNGEEAVYELLGRLYRTVPYATKIDLEQAFREQFLLEKPGFRYRLDLLCRVWEGGELLWQNSRMSPSV